jgi:hypothetical protein
MSAARGQLPAWATWRIESVIAASVASNQIPCR